MKLLHSLLTSISIIPLLLPTPTTSVPTLENIACTPRSIPLGTTFKLTFKLRDDPKKPARGVANLQVFAQNALVESTQTATEATSTAAPTATSTSDIDIPPPPEPMADSDASNDPTTRVQNVVDLSTGEMDVEFDWYRFGPYGIVNYTDQPLCIRSSMPYGKDIDALGNPEGYADQTVCPLACTIVEPVQEFAYFSNLSFTPRSVNVGSNLTISWNYQNGTNFPNTVLLSVSFASNYYEEYPQYIIGDVPAAPGKYIFKVPQSLLDFITRNTKPDWPFRLYFQLAFPPQTNALGGVFTDPKANLTVRTARDWRRTGRKTVTMRQRAVTLRRVGGVGYV
ncbi:hypothetical protein HDV00_011292 [Rhizophlyctis rosea]|nr:hypothetical protein HDV00_011292 [Rhizophlyctis rosea]